MPDQSDRNSKLSDVMNYLKIDESFIRQGKASTTRAHHVVSDVVNALNTPGAYHLEVVKAFTEKELRLNLYEIYVSLVERNFDVHLLNSLDTSGEVVSEDLNTVFMITEDQLHLDNETEREQVSKILTGRSSTRVKGIPLVFGITENTYNLLTKIRTTEKEGESWRNKYLSFQLDKFMGIGFILISAPFVVIAAELIARTSTDVATIFYITVAMSILTALGIALFALGISFSQEKVHKESIIALLLLAIVNLVVFLLYLTGLFGIATSTSPPTNSGVSSINIGSGFVSVLFEIIIAGSSAMIIFPYLTNGFRWLTAFGFLAASASQLIVLAIIFFNFGTVFVNPGGVNIPIPLPALLQQNYYLSYYNSGFIIHPFLATTLNTIVLQLENLVVTYLAIGLAFFSNMIFFIVYLFGGISLFSKDSPEANLFSITK